MSAAVMEIPANLDAPIVAVEQLGVSFSRDGKRLKPVKDVSFTLRRGETLCIIGESGSGKSLTLRALIGQMPFGATLDGTIRLQGRDVTHVSAEERRQIRGAQIGTIFQEPATALDPVYTVGRQITEAIMAHQNISRDVAAGRALELLELVAIPNAKRRFNAYPHEMSGGMRQRAMIAVALACRPDVLLADEPTTALDVTVQMQVLLLLRGLQQKFGMSVIFVTHDIAVAAEIGDQVAVMYAGSIVEMGTAEQVLLAPQHPYTRALLDSRATAASRGSDIPMIPGGPPNPADLPPGCSFNPRCRYRADICTIEGPEPRSLAGGRIIRCWKSELDTASEEAGGR